MLFDINENLGDFFYDEPMKNHTSFCVGGPAKLLIKPNDEEALIEILKSIRKNNYKYYILGNCTNIIVKDKGFDGIIIKLKNKLNDVKKVSDKEIFAGTGASMKKISEFAMENSLTGLEFAHGIPGSLGGAIVMNAGAYDGEIKNVCKSVRLLDENLEVIEVPGDEMNFAYRHSLVQERDLIVLGATFSLEDGNKDEIRKKYEDFDQRRADKQPLDMPSAGSTFKRPTGYFAGKLIDDSGLRGFTHKGAGISQKHCGFVVNKNKAAAQDILETIEIVQKVVHDKFDVTLEREVKIIGD
ncbi:UDP-N-acetylenolpyruvoylglucosamine reductase [Peptoniphilus sp. HMSC075B08]|uniref:UDP-N-acetylmuramate dehydrogenase n=1 Tax=Peptoniphilus sp. HMSC075B08 TaxID=1739525 RepID=UPI0008A57A58|nr:UDP-N-acetylmuramate dehydrogenase [Peptoniphilus sp. HMSC075B08]OFO63154.1 UDP-N-acetylenolpyruvoylglucosamine reductase [Peptoniphilus sp. HMSC075B08]